MGLWNAPSDYDYEDLGRVGVRCATRDCEHDVTFPTFEVFCSECLNRQREQVAIAHALVEAQRLKAKVVPHDDMPIGFAHIDRVKEDGDWLHVTWGRDAQGGAAVYKTKIPTIAVKAKQAYRDRVPVHLVSKRFPYLDDVEWLAR